MSRVFICAAGHIILCLLDGSFLAQRSVARLFSFPRKHLTCPLPLAQAAASLRSCGIPFLTLVGKPMAASHNSGNIPLPLLHSGSMIRPCLSSVLLVTGPTRY